MNWLWEHFKFRPEVKHAGDNCNSMLDFKHKQFIEALRSIDDKAKMNKRRKRLKIKQYRICSIH